MLVSLGRIVMDQHVPKGAGWMITVGDLYMDYDKSPNHIPVITIDGVVTCYPGYYIRSVRLVLSKGRIKFSHLASSERSRTPSPRGRTRFLNEQEVLAAVSEQAKRWYAQPDIGTNCIG